MLATVLVLLSAVASTRADPVNFAQLEGTYLSSILGGCELRLEKDASFMLSCRNRVGCRGRAMSIPPGFVVLCPDTAARLSFALRAANQRAPPTEWPPPTRDPTKGPFRGYPPSIESQTRVPEALWLEPVLWGPRVYLVEHDDHDVLCGRVEVGVKLRSLPWGHFFLRRGDHRKRPHSKTPSECSQKQRAAEQREKLTKPERNGALQLVPGVRRTTWGG
jgi:hypothetical protein